jgi:HTH-type transcriptional regulator, global nitrogen regulator NrpRI
MNMVGQETRDGEAKLIAILRALSKSARPVGSNTLTRTLEEEGVNLSERGVRYHLKIADARGFTLSFGRGGRMITPQGRREIKEALAPRQVGSIANKLKALAFQTTFDPVKKSGLVPVNISFIDKENYKQAVDAMRGPFLAGLCAGQLAALAYQGERLGSVIVPPGKVGFATICSVVINGVLLRSGISSEYKFGGMLEYRDAKPRRFVSIIDYAGTSLEPSEEIISSRITSVGEAARTGNGRVLGVFRAIPLAAREAAEEKIALLKEVGIGGVCAAGAANEPLCQVTVDMNRFGLIQLNGLNPLAAAVEAGIEIENSAGSGLLDFQQLQPFWKLRVEDFRVHRSHCQGE